MAERESVLQGLKGAYIKTSEVADKINSLIDLETDPEMKAIISDVSNRVYSMAVDIKSAAEDYVDLKGEMLEDGIDAFDELEDTEETLEASINDDEEQLEPSV